VVTPELKPTLLPLGDRALLVRFAETLSEAANRAAIALARRLAAEPVPGVAEMAPGLVSVLLRVEQGSSLETVRREVMLRLGGPEIAAPPARHEIAVSFDGEDLAEVAAALRLTPASFVARHNAQPLRVLATGFAPGFVYCGFHDAALLLPRREAVRPLVPAGTVGTPGPAGPVMAATVAMRALADATPALPANGSAVATLVIAEAVMPLQGWEGAAAEL